MRVFFGSWIGIIEDGKIKSIRSHSDRGGAKPQGDCLENSDKIKRNMFAELIGYLCGEPHQIQRIQDDFQGAREKRQGVRTEAWYYEGEGKVLKLTLKDLRLQGQSLEEL